MIDILSHASTFIMIALSVLLGYVIGYRNRLSIKHGIIHVSQDEDHDSYLFEFRIPPEQIPKMENVVFKVSLENARSQNLQGS